LRHRCLSHLYQGISIYERKLVLFVCENKERQTMTREKNPKYESMSLEELKANMEKSKKELEQAMHNKNILEQRKKLIERKERSHRLVVKGAEFEKAFPMSKDLEQEDFQKVMNEMKVLKYNRDTVRDRYLEAGRKERQQIAEEVKKTTKGDDS
jgi:Na+-translocating ferredoxin:NAD+ oxidoreductase RnfC subunit